MPIRMLYMLNGTAIGVVFLFVIPSPLTSSGQKVMQLDYTGNETNSYIVDYTI